jgi:hypothetical protein
MHQYSTTFNELPNTKFNLLLQIVLESKHCDGQTLPAHNAVLLNFYLLRRRHRNNTVFDWSNYMREICNN